MLPANLSADQFLKEYWQKKPLLLKNAFPDFEDPLSPEELAGLACEEGTESRLIFNDNASWQVQNGPFSEDNFTSLPDNNWTLLVQAVDHWFPEVKKLLQAVDFIPDWRVDDIMVSYASEAAGVGPHFDYYDVFIIQGQGRRKWQLGQRCDSSSPLLTGVDMKILEEFEVQDEFILEPGDAIYIPPGCAHQGISIGSSLSYSIGFRAPSHTEVISQYAARLCAALTEDDRYTDPDLTSQKNSSEITHKSLQKIKKIIQKHLQNDRLIEQYFGESMTQRKYPEYSYLPDDELSLDLFVSLLEEKNQLEKHPAARFAFTKDNNSFLLFADGETFQLNTADKLINDLVDELCDRKKSIISFKTYASSKPALALLNKLYNQGSLVEFEQAE